MNRLLPVLALAALPAAAWAQAGRTETENKLPFDQWIERNGKAGVSMVLILDSDLPAC